jgi:hypothetical protein
MKHLVLNAVLAAVIVFAGFRCLIGVRHWNFTPQPWKQIDIACISVGAIAEIILTLAAGLRSEARSGRKTATSGRR